MLESQLARSSEDQSEDHAGQKSRQISNITRPLKIALLAYRSHPFSGGQGIYIRYLSQALVNAGHQVDVISGPPYPDLDVRVNLIKLPSLDLYEEKSHIKALKWEHLLSFTDFFEWFTMLTGGFAEPYTYGRRLTRYFKNHKPKYDILHDNQSLCYGTLKLQQNGQALLTTIHHPITRDLKIALANEENWGMRILIRRWHSFLKMQKKVVRKLDNIVTVSEVSRVDIADAFSIPSSALTVIHNGIDTDVFQPVPDIKPREYSIMATASADQPLKGLQYLLCAIALLVPTYPQIHLTVLGKIKTGGDIDNLLGELNLGEHLSFVSGIETIEVVKLYARASIVVVPSIYEGFGLPAGEAMACGVPVISTDGGALPEVVGDCGIIVPVRNPEAIKDAIAQLFENPKQRKELSRLGRERIVNLFSWEVAARELVELYTEIIEKKASR
ncbi:MAG: glycosyltransferase involved in cell wall biosynthesis [Candidatus Azotimanducaceae bacterium]|jgi:glycosyltransferase involved in cell wall biosynthesis